MIAKALTAFLGVLIEQAQKPVLEALGSTVLSTPDVAANAELVKLWTAALGATGAAYVLFVLAGGVTVMGYESVQTRYALKQIAPRLLLGMVGSAGSLMVMSKSIALANAGSVAIMGRGVDSKGVAQQLANAVTRRFVTGDQTYLLVLQLLLLVLMFGVLIGYVLRVALIYVLAVAAPPALACYSLPAADGVARLWWRAFLGCLAMQLAQSTTFIVGLRLFFAPGNTMDGLGLPRTSRLGNLLAGLCLFWILWKIPGWTARVVFRSTPVSLPGTPMPLRMLRSLAIAYVMRGAFRGAGRLGRPQAGGRPGPSPGPATRPGPPPSPGGRPPGGCPDPGGGYSPPLGGGGGPQGGPANPGAGTGPSGPAPRPRPTESGGAGSPSSGPGPSSSGGSSPPVQRVERPQPQGPRVRHRQTVLPIPVRRVPARSPRPAQLRLPLETPPVRRDRER
ncbi:hypothetical protein [Actinacidiphila sp. bgisy167]|uniref:hypothetical protein n=1 Tax=Actinacidiphila sp. bgisy167 TaxID=3413797 RepID=UPI003D739BFC